MTPRPRIPIARPTLGEEEALAAAAVVRSGWLAMGPRVAELEQAVATFVGARHAVAVSSGTAALQLALEALGLGPGDEVIVPALSFVASANAVLHAGARPVFVDVDRHTYNLTAEGAAAALGPRTRALLPVHQLGLPAPLDPILELARDRGIAVVEDAACALGARYRGRPIGGAGGGALCCFSFHPRKVVTTGEGGMITTGDAALAARLRLLRAQGAAGAAGGELADEFGLPAAPSSARGPEFPLVGHNFRLSDVAAAIGVEQMKRLPALLARRRALAARYGEELRGVGGVTPPLEPPELAHAFQSYMVLLEGAAARPRVMERLAADGIATRRAVTAIPKLACYRERCAGLVFPGAEHVDAHGLQLPLYPDLSEDDLSFVVASLRRALRGSR
jgi:perosamine synthetase